ncbi:PRC-barrel domain-containing protein [Spirulina sp. CS-785/01]|uniref:PRC-barrel domain-containing protein n=1 Tax=Spirulina sp. CS-785/01 TaxID=3021716 RepID=UPI00232C6C8A|nr:PRC-barrel domain-containing protein [Spirulina sp. CS-785/01]MDB9311761.1 PRC-barrel domain-containing protein [Spirulina sp. CS-785/01]
MLFVRKANEVLNFTVQVQETGEILDYQIEDLLVNQNRNLCLGFLVSEGGRYQQNQCILPLEAVVTLSKGVVITQSEQDLIPRCQGYKLPQSGKRGIFLKGDRILTTDGQNLGTIVDFYFDPQTGVIEGYEVAGGLFTNARIRYSFVPKPTIIEVGAEVMVVPPETIEQMEETCPPHPYSAASLTHVTLPLPAQKDFIMGKIAQTPVISPEGETLVQTGQEINSACIERVHKSGQLYDLYQAVGGNPIGQMGEKIVSAIAPSNPNNLNAAQGRRAYDMVRGEDGVIIVAQGQIVDQTAIQQSITYHKQKELLQSVHLLPRQPEHHTQSLWEQIRAKAKHCPHPEPDQRIQQALGRPVTRVICDRRGNIILDIGDLITHRAVEQARKADVLDRLLSATYQDQPNLKASSRSRS